MRYHISKIVADKSFESAIEQVTVELQKEGFGILTEIDVKETFKKKLDVDFKNYKILGACNPHFAYKALSSEDKIGVFLPCNIIVEEHENGEIEVSAVDPIASMSSVENPDLGELALEIQQKLVKVIDCLV
jgi:uncharacterized protein (DUF302 family)